MRTALLTTVGIFALIQTTAKAQLAPPAPTHQSIDGNGVDLFLGTFTLAAPALSMGQGSDQGMVYTRMYRSDAGWSDNYITALNQIGLKTIVSLGGMSDEFTTNSGGLYVPTQGNGATLIYTSATHLFTYTRADGTVIHFDEGNATPQPYFSNKGRAKDITYPGGNKISYIYDSIPYCEYSNTTEYCLQEGRKFAYRISSVQNSYGYKISFTYGDILPYDPENYQNWPDFYTWSTPLTASAINLATAAGGSSPGQKFDLDYISGNFYYRITDSLNRQTSYRMLDGLPGIVGITRPGSASEDVTLAYSGTKVTSIATASGTTTYSYVDTGGVRTTVVTDPLSHVWTYKFDIASQRMTSMTDPLSHTTNWRYDGEGRVEYVVRPEGTFTTGSPPMPESDYTKYTYDSRGNVTDTLTVPRLGSSLENIETHASFPMYCNVSGINQNTCNKPTTTTDAKGYVTSYDYDLDTGGVSTVTLPWPASVPLATTHYVYSPLKAYYKNSSGTIVEGETVYKMTRSWRCANVNCEEDSADAIVTINDYGPQTPGVGNNLLLKYVTTKAGDNSLSATTGYTYDDVGNRVAIDGPMAGSGDTTVAIYDAGRQFIGAIGPAPGQADPALANRAVRYTYDLKGRVTLTERGTTSGQTGTNWAAFTSLQSVSSTYDGDGHKLSDTAGGGGTIYGLTQYSYDAAGRLDCTATRMTNLGLGSPPLGACSQTPSATIPDRITKQGYDAANRTTSLQSGYGTSLMRTEGTTTYTGDGQVASVADAKSNVTTYEYDGFNRLAKTNYPSVIPGSDYTGQSYDKNGNVTSVRLRDGTSIALEYNKNNWLTKKTLPNSEPEVSYTYDLLGRLKTASQVGNALSFNYDALSRNISQSGQLGAIDLEYDKAGRRTKLIWNDGTTNPFYISYDYLTTGQVSAIREKGATSGAGVLGLYYYNNLGQRTGLTRGNGTTNSWGYDNVSRLTGLAQDLASSEKDLIQGFSYNNASQISQATRSNDIYAPTSVYNTDRDYTSNVLNQYTQAGSKTLSYDARGNLTAIGDKAYGYNSENYLTSGPEVTLDYDPMGRLFQVTGTATTKFGYDGQDLIGEYDSSGNLLRRYVHGPGTDEVLNWYEGAGTSDRRWLHADERGSIIAVSDGSGNSIATNGYDDWGNPNATNVGRFQYTGQAWVPELGMYYYKARFYESKLGRFMQTDPIGYGDSMNLYAYVRNDPVNAVDPSGLSCILEQYEYDSDGNLISWIPQICDNSSDAGSGSIWLNNSYGLISQASDAGGGSFAGVSTLPQSDNGCSSGAPSRQITLDAGIFLGYGGGFTLGIDWNADTNELTLFRSARVGKGIGLTAGFGFSAANASPTAGRSRSFNAGLSVGAGYSYSRDLSTGASTRGKGVVGIGKVGGELSVTDNLTETLKVPIMAGVECPKK